MEALLKYIIISIIISILRHKVGSEFLNGFTNGNNYGNFEPSQWMDRKNVVPNNRAPIQKPVQPARLPFHHAIHHHKLPDLQENGIRKRPADFDHLLPNQFEARRTSWQEKSAESRNAGILQVRKRTKHEQNEMLKGQPMVPAIGPTLQRNIIADRNLDRKRSRHENDSNLSKRPKSVYDEIVLNQQERSTVTKEELYQLHQVEPLLESPELQYAVRVVEMQTTEVQITARGGRRKTAQISQPRQAREPAPLPRANTAQKVVQQQMHNRHKMQEKVAVNMQGLEEVSGITHDKTILMENRKAQLAKTMNTKHGAMEQKMEKNMHNLPPNVFQFNAQPKPIMRTRESVESVSMHTASMKDAWTPKNSVASVNGMPKNTAKLEDEKKVENGQKMAEKLENERKMAEKLENERIMAEKLENERKMTQKLEYQRKKAEKLENERKMAEKLENERKMEEKLENERKMKEKLENERNKSETEKQQKIQIAIPERPSQAELRRRSDSIFKMISDGKLDVHKIYRYAQTVNIKQKAKEVIRFWAMSSNKTLKEMIKYCEQNGAKTDMEKLSFSLEVWQARLGAPCRCDPSQKLTTFDKMIKISDLFFSVEKNPMGSGGTAKVYRGNSEFLERCVAIKLVNMQEIPAELQKQYQKEAGILQILTKFNAKYSVRMFRTYDKNDKLAMALELGVMDLRKLWQQNVQIYSKQNLGAQFVERLYMEMMEAVAEFHHIGMHLDLKLDNFLAVPDENGFPVILPNGQTIKVRTKLIDFGGANLIRPELYRADRAPDVLAKMQMDTTACIRHTVPFGTPNYMSPEQIKSCNGYYMVSTKADIWAMGTVLYEMLRGEAPYSLLCSRQIPQWQEWEGLGRDQKLAKFKQCIFGMLKDPEAVHRIDYPTRKEMDKHGGTHHLWNIVKASLQLDPIQRPTAKGILRYLRSLCRLQLNKAGDLAARNEGVPLVRCELDPKEGELRTKDPYRFNPY